MHESSASPQTMTVISWNGQKPMSPPPVKLRGQGKLVSEIVLEDRG